MTTEIAFDISVQELQTLRNAERPHTLIDVREADEYAYANIGGRLVPLGSVPGLINELDPDDDIILMCHTGSRSAMATQFLRKNGFEKARNLRGGIDAWSVHIDPTIKRY